MIVSGTNLKITRGDTGAIRVAVSDAAGEAVPLEDGDTIELTVRERLRSPEKILYKKVTEFVYGEALITIHPEDTSNLKFKTYVYDIQLTRANGQVQTIVKPSQFEVGSEVTYD